MTTLYFYQNDSLMGGSFWQKDRMVTHILLIYVFLNILPQSQILVIGPYLEERVPDDQANSLKNFGVFNVLQKTNKNKSHNSKIEFLCSFFGGNIGLKKKYFDFV